MPNKQCSKQWQQVTETPWLNPETLRLVNLILSSHIKAFEESLISNKILTNSNKGKATEIFTLESPVIAHDNRGDPCLIYANQTALQLWGRSWHEMIGMPSRLTAPESERKKRKDALNEATKQNALKDYQGIRINSKGELVIIKKARIWTLWNEERQSFGQAATFNNWWKI